MNFPAENMKVGFSRLAGQPGSPGFPTLSPEFQLWAMAARRQMSNYSGGPGVAELWNLDNVPGLP